MMGLLFRFYLASKVQLDFVSLPRQLKFEQVLISIQIVASCFLSIRCRGAPGTPLAVDQPLCSLSGHGSDTSCHMQLCRQVNQE